MTFRSCSRRRPVETRAQVLKLRGSAAPAADIEGSGLGLPIAQWIAQAHGGTLAFTSDSAHTEFICTLPPSPAP